MKNAKDPKILNIVKFFTVLLLHENSKYGYEIMKEIGEKIEKNVSPGQIYPFLKALEKQGYVSSKQIGTREKKIYSLTNKGRKFTKGMINRFGDIIDIAVEPRLTKCVHCSCEIYKGGHKEKIESKELVFCCCHCAESYKKLILK